MKDPVEFMMQFDDGSYQDSTLYVGPFWLARSGLVVLSQNIIINYLAFLHDKAYENPNGHKAGEIDIAFRECIKQETSNDELANVMYKWVNMLNFISWGKARLVEWIKDIRYKNGKIC